MEINPNEMATNTTPKKLEKIKFQWLHDFKSSFRELELTYRQSNFEEIKKYLGQTPLKRVGEYFSEEKISQYKQEFKDGVRRELFENPYWVNLVDNQIEYVNHAKSPEEFQEAFQKLKKLFE